MEMVTVCVIQDYCGKENGKDLFRWSEIEVPMHKVDFVDSINQMIPSMFALEESERQIFIGQLVIIEHNNGISQYFPFLKKYVSKEIAEFLSMGSVDVTENKQYNKK